MFSQTPGTALGIGQQILRILAKLLLAAHFWTQISKTTIFWLHSFWHIHLVRCWRFSRQIN